MIVKVFSATKAEDRNLLGERVTEWIKLQRDFTVTEIRTLQSSDEAYHCLSVIVLGRQGSGYVRPAPTTMPGPPEKREPR